MFWLLTLGVVSVLVGSCTFLAVGFSKGKAAGDWNRSTAYADYLNARFFVAAAGVGPECRTWTRHHGLAPGCPQVTPHEGASAGPHCMVMDCTVIEAPDAFWSDPRTRRQLSALIRDLDGVCGRLSPKEWYKRYSLGCDAGEPRGRLYVRTQTSGRQFRVL